MEVRRDYKREHQLIKVQKAVDTASKIIDNYRGRGEELPPDVAANLKDIIMKADEVIHRPQSPPSMKVINGKSKYFTGPETRLTEAQAFAGGFGAESKEAAYAYIMQQLNPQNPRLELMVELLREILMQWGSSKPLDFRLVSQVRNEWQKARQKKVLLMWNGLCDDDWMKVCRRFDSTGEFYYDLGEYRAYPTALTPEGKPDTKLATKPLPERRGFAQTYDIEDMATAQKWQQEIAQPKHGINIISTLKRCDWNTGAYPRRGTVQRELYMGLRQFVQKKVQEFVEEHGQSTPIMILRDFMPNQTILKSEFAPAFKVVKKADSD
jgi:hypothetical protein